MTVRFRIAAVLAICTFVGLAGTGVSYALWGARATTAGTVTAGDIGISQSGFDSIAHTFTSTSQTHTGELTITNTGSFPSPYTVAFAVVGGSTTLATAVSVSAWVRPVGGDCSTQPTTAGAGTWSSMPALAGPLDAGASTTYCLRTNLAAGTDPGPGVTVAAAATTTLGSWSATTGPISVTQSVVSW